jgi:hypothetical protein
MQNRCAWARDVADTIGSSRKKGQDILKETVREVCVAGNLVYVRLVLAQSECVAKAKLWSVE